MLSYKDWYEMYEKDLNLMVTECGYDQEDDWNETQNLWYEEMYVLYKCKVQAGIK